LALYSKDLIEKPEYILITKSDLVSPDELSQKISQLSHLHRDILVTSIIDDASIKELSDTLVKIMRSM
jgi:ethanolamine utilization protein EutP (predicted NTPase)